MCIELTTWRRRALMLVFFFLLIAVVVGQAWQARGVVPRVPDLPYFPERNGRGVPSYCADDLGNMGEPSLWKASLEPSRTSYRLICVPSFHPALAIRVEKTTDGAELRWIELADQSGSPSTPFRTDRKVSLTREQWADLDALADRSGFWEMPSADPRLVSDGVALVVEGVRKGRYHSVHRQSPEPGAYRRLCVYLASLAGKGHPGLAGDHEPMPVRLGNFTLVKTRKLALAVRFLEHTEIGRGGSDYRGATYEWFLQADGSGDFTKANVTRGKGKVLGAPEYRPDQMSLACGPLMLEWSPSYDDRDYLSVRRGDCKVGWGEVIELADTDWNQLKDVDLRDKYLIWSSGK